MLISHAHKFVFVKTTKTACSSLEALLVDYLKEGDLVKIISSARKISREEVSAAIDLFER